MSKTPMTVSDLIGGYYILKYPKRQKSRRRDFIFKVEHLSVQAEEDSRRFTNFPN